MISIRKPLIIIILIVCLSGFLSAQFFSEAMSVEALRPFWNINGFGASSFSLHNNALLSGDISSTQSNPAFLLNIQRPKASLSTNSLIYNYNSSLVDANSEVSSKSTTFHTDYFGFAYPVSVYQGAMVLAVSYEPSAYYYSTLKSNGIATIDLGNVTEEMDIEESGSMNTLCFAGAVEFMPNFNFGMSLNFHSGNRSYESIQYESDTENIFTYSTINNLETIKPEYDGFNMDLGITYQSENFKFGLRISTPLNMTIHEFSEFSRYYTYDTDSDTLWIDNYNIEYTSRYPWEVAPSFAIKLGSITFGADLIVHNWQDIEVDQLDIKDAVNYDLYWNLRRTTDISLSIAMPLGKSISTRFAYRRIPSPYENLQNEDEEINHLIGAGVETILMKSLILGCSYQRAIGNQTIPHPYFDTFSTQKYQEDRLTVSMAVLF